MSYDAALSTPVEVESSRSRRTGRVSQAARAPAKFGTVGGQIIWPHLWSMLWRIAITLGWPQLGRATSSTVNDNQQSSFWQQHLLTLVCRTSIKLGLAGFLVLFLGFVMPRLTIMTFANESAEPNRSAPTRLFIPGINLDEEIIPLGWKEVKIEGKTYGQWLADDERVGWHKLSAPLGRVGNTVINGHSDIRGRVFRNLGRVQIGDRLTVFSDDGAFHYVVGQKIWVQEKGVSLQQRIENARLIMPTNDERLTLITCAYPGATHRLIVIAYPVGQ